MLKIAASTVVATGFLVKVGTHDDASLKEITVPSLKAASRAVSEFIEEDCIGSSDFAGGEVLDEESREVVAVVSYNGRVWMPGGKNPEGKTLASHDLEFDLDA